MSFGVTAVKLMRTSALASGRTWLGARFWMPSQLR